MEMKMLGIERVREREKETVRVGDRERGREAERRGTREREREG